MLIHMHEPQWSAVRIITHFDRFVVVKSFSIIPNLVTFE